VVKAAELEKNIQVAGLFYDETWLNFIKQRSSQLNLQNFIAPFTSIPNFNAQALAPNLFGVTFTQYEGWAHWCRCIASGDQTNSKVINSNRIIAELKATYLLP
jgi:hypothetical protein